MHGRIVALGLLVIAGCVDSPGTPAPQVERTPIGQEFDPNTVGKIEGRVQWEGAVPIAKATTVRSIAYNPHLYKRLAQFSTPHIPNVEAKSSGVGGAVIYLKGVDPRRARPWDHANIAIEFRDRTLCVKQGETRSQVGFVQKGSAVQIVNGDDEYHLLRARGAAFFAMPLVERNKTQERVLATNGVVDLTCGAGYYWLQAHLFVADHPYYARTDEEGRFAMERVPPGTYEIVCWLPSWRVEREERDPETADVARWIWLAPKEQAHTVRVKAHQINQISFCYSAKMFGD